MDTRGQGEQEDIVVLIKRLIARARTNTPGVVTRVSDDGQTVEVAPAIRKFVTLDGVQTSVDIPPIIEVPLIMPHAQTLGFSLTLPVSVGDEVALMICDRSIDAWVEFGGIQNPNEPVTSRTHNITDSLAIIGATPEPRKISDFQLDRMEMRNADRSVRVSLGTDSLELTFGATSITLSATGINISGAITTDNTITATGDVLGAGVSLSTHTHGYIDNIGAPPVPTPSVTQGPN